MSVYLAFAQSGFQTQLAYRNQVWANLFGKIVQIFARVAIWLAVYSGTAIIGGVSRQEMITYALLGGAVIGAANYETIIGGIGKALKTGDVAIWLLKPIHYPLYVLATEFGTASYRFIVLVVPTVVVVALIYGMLPPASIFDGIMFAAYWALALIIYCLIAALFGLTAFWLLTTFSLEWLLQALINLLSGSLIPFWFFPEPFGLVARHLPFAWMVYYPSAVWLGRLSDTECLVYFGLGLVWAALLALGVALLWRRASLRIIVQGG